MACAGSLALHALVLVIVARVDWQERAPQVAESEPVPESVVWLGALRLPAPAPEPQPAAPVQPPESRQPSDPTAPPEPPRPDTAPPEPSTPDTVPPGGADSPDNYVVTQAELEEAWDRAREEMRERQEREQGYLTFSLDDVIEAPLPEEPGPSESIFDRAARSGGSGGGASVLTPGQARTRVGRALAEFCNALTGGIGLGFGGTTFGTACAERGESPNLFAHITPAYLRSRPVCTEIAPATADGAPPTIKCELVEQEEEGAR